MDKTNELQESLIRDLKKENVELKEKLEGKTNLVDIMSKKITQLQNLIKKN